MLDAINPFSSPRPKTPELTPIQASAQLRQAWAAGVGSARDYVFTPAVSGDSVFVAAYDGTIARIDGGREVWRTRADQRLSGGVGADEKLVAVGTAKGEILAFDAGSGAALWKGRVSSEVLSAPEVAEGLVIVRSGDNRVYALEAVDGKRRWVYQRATPALSLRSAAGVVVADKAVLAGFPGGKLVAISSANGAALWEGTVALPRGATELERVADVTSVPMVDGRQVCAAAFQGRVACFDIASGNLLWARDLSSSAGVAIDNLFVYVTDEKGGVHALDRSNGASIWKQDKLLGRGVGRPLAVGEFVAVGDVQGVVHLLRREDGAFAARLHTDGSAISADPQRQGREIVVQTRAGGVYALAP
jgi:outer membrane protein assembly factor BamB